jgi:hypothetical protein
MTDIQVTVDAEHPVTGTLIVKVSVYPFLGKPYGEEIGVAFHTSGIIGKSLGHVQAALGLPVDLRNVLEPLAINILNSQSSLLGVKFNSSRRKMALNAVGHNPAFVGVMSRLDPRLRRLRMDMAGLIAELVGASIFQALMARKDQEDRTDEPTTKEVQTLSFQKS